MTERERERQLYNVWTLHFTKVHINIFIHISVVPKVRSNIHSKESNRLQQSKSSSFRVSIFVVIEQLFMHSSIIKKLHLYYDIYIPMVPSIGHVQDISYVYFKKCIKFISLNFCIYCIAFSTDSVSLAAAGTSISFKSR